MDVYLIPTARAGRYELYYESAEDDVVGAVEGEGLLARIKRSFAEMLADAEEWRRRRREARPEPATLLQRLRRRIMGFVVERIAEQRLLWHLRRASQVCACIPSDLSEREAHRIIRGMLEFDVQRHFKWLLIDTALLVPAAFLTVIPGPNIVGLYFLFQVVSHYLSWTGARCGLALMPWRVSASADLAELRGALSLAPPQRQQRFAELASRLRLEHLAAFLEDVAARPA